MSEEYSREQLDQILEEVAEFHVELIEDPTLPDQRYRYIQERLAQCRRYQNRTQYYLQKVKKQEKDVRLEMQKREMDLEFKMQNLLANDPTVRQQASATDRKALAIAKLKDEYTVLAESRNELSNIVETFKLIKMKYDDLNKTSQDIKLQRQMIKDETGEDPYSPPSRKQDKTIDGGMKPPVRAQPVTAEELLNPNTRPEDLPEPKDAAHAEQIANFISNIPQNSRPQLPAEEAIESITYDDLLEDDKPTSSESN